MNREDLIDFLNEYGLGGLIGNIDRAIQEDPEQFMGPFARQAAFRAVRDTPEYKERFKGLKLRQDAGLPPISEDQYLQIEDDYRQALRTNGMPKGFYDTQEDFAKFIGADVRGDELNTRLQSGYRAVMETEPGTKEELKRLYGLQDADIAAYFIDPARFSQSEAVKRAEAARRASTAREQGFTIGAAQAEELVQRGVTQAEAQRGFGTLAEQRGLFEAQMAGEEAIGQEEQIAAAFGTSAEAAQRIATRRRRRQAAFEAGGQLATTGTGVAGLRTATQ